jgi:hypothetical protein
VSLRSSAKGTTGQATRRAGIGEEGSLGVASTASTDLPNLIIYTHMGGEGGLTKRKWAGVGAKAAAGYLRTATSALPGTGSHGGDGRGGPPDDSGGWGSGEGAGARRRTL